MGKESPLLVLELSRVDGVGEEGWEVCLGRETWAQFGGHPYVHASPVWQLRRTRRARGLKDIPVGGDWRGEGRCRRHGAGHQRLWQNDKHQYHISVQAPSQVWPGTSAADAVLQRPIPKAPVEGSKELRPACRPQTLPQHCNGPYIPLYPSIIGGCKERLWALHCVTLTPELNITNRETKC